MATKYEIASGINTVFSILGSGTASGTGLASAFTDTKSEEGKKKAGNLSIASGISGASGRLLDAVNAVISFKTGKNDAEKEQGLWGGLSSVFGMGAGIMDILGGMATKNSEKNTQKYAGIASGAFGGISGALTAYQGLRGIQTAGDNEDKKRTGLTNIIGGLASALGGTVGAFGSAFDNNYLKKGGVISNAISPVANLISEVVGLFIKNKTNPVENSNNQSQDVTVDSNQADAAIQTLPQEEEEEDN